MTKKKATKKSAPKSKPRPKASKPKKAAARKKPAAKRNSPAVLSGPEQVTTGKGPAPAAIGADLVALFNAGKAEEPCRKWWANEIVSIEGATAFHGRKAAEEKNKGWYEQNELLGGSAEGPYVGGTGFAVKFNVHVRERATGREIQMCEIGVYTVRDGKIISEEFMYGS